MPDYLLEPDRPIGQDPIFGLCGSFKKPCLLLLKDDDRRLVRQAALLAFALAGNAVRRASDTLH
jgi:hypothetical protein